MRLVLCLCCCQHGMQGTCTASACSVALGALAADCRCLVTEAVSQQHCWYFKGVSLTGLCGCPVMKQLLRPLVVTTELDSPT
jgi:hypothetical protein